MGKSKVPSVTKARRLASAYITAWGQYERAEASWASTLSGEAPAGRGFRHSLEARDLAAAELNGAEHGLARARFAVVQNHCPDWCNAGSRLLSTDHGHSGPLQLAHAIASGREFVHAKHFDDAFGLDPVRLLGIPMGA